MNRYTPILHIAALLAGLSCNAASTDETVLPACDPEWRIEPLDIWGRTLTGVTASGDTGPTALATPLTVRIEAPDHIASDVTVTRSGAGVTVTATGGALWAEASAAEDSCERVVFVGLDHVIYASGAPAPKAGNDIALLMDGQSYWQRVYDDLVARPTERVHQTTWWWQSDFELIRPETHVTDSPDVRRTRTMIELLGGRDVVRVLVARFAAGRVGGLAYMNTDSELRAHGQDPDDGFEVMSQENPTLAPLDGVYVPEPIVIDFAGRVAENATWAQWRFKSDPTKTGALEALEAASYHQKGLVIGDSIAYISGMNVKSTDWDSSDHRVFDARRMIFTSTTEERQAVLDRKTLPDRGPRKDYGFRIEGPLARDADNVLKRRWDLGLQTGALFPGDHTPYELLPPGPEAGTLTGQVVATLPPPIAERAIFETQAKAVARARNFIYIEDQYFRAPLLDEIILKRMEENPDVHLVVVTKPVSAADGGKKWTWLSDEAYRTRFPNRYLLLQLKTFDIEAGVPYFLPMDTHSKITIVDDDYVTAGSANKNNRGYLYEGELNAAVWDVNFGREARTRVLKNLVGELADEITPDADGETLYTVLRALAEENAAAEAALLEDPDAPDHPVGFVYPLEFTEDYAVDVGPDVF